MKNSNRNHQEVLRIALFHSYGSLIDGPDSGGGTYEASMSVIFENLKTLLPCELVHFVPAEKAQRGKRQTTFLGSPVVYFSPSLLERWASEKAHSWRMKLVFALGRSRTPRLLKRHNIDLAYFSSPSHMALRVGNVPYIFTVWDTGHRDLPEFTEMSAPREVATRENLYQNAIPGAFHVIVDSPATGLKLQDFYGLGADSWSSLGLLPHVPEVDHLPRILDGDYIIYPAARWPHKNHETLFRAFRHLVTTRPQLQLVLTGSDAGYGKQLDSLAQDLGIGDQIIDRGLVTRDELLVLIRDARALVMPSLLGPTNIPPLEALALGTPAIVSDVHNYGTFVDELLTRVPAMDADQWALAIETALRGERPAKVVFTFDEAVATLTRVLRAFPADSPREDSWGQGRH